MSDIEDEDGFTFKYWICDDCALAKDWTAPKYAVTCIGGKCGWCRSGIDTTLTPTCDFKKPGGAEPVWD